jgi:hypothetical protein
MRGGDSSTVARRISPDDKDAGDYVDPQPPVYINALVGSVGSMPISPKKKTSERGLAIASHSSSAQIPLPDLSVSPLTASSYQTMEKHYDQDTWRMHNRIAASRTEQKSYTKKQSTSQDSSLQSAAMLSFKSEILNGGTAKAIIEDHEDDDDDDDEDALCIFDFDE